MVGENICRLPWEQIRGNQSIQIYWYWFSPPYFRPNSVQSVITGIDCHLTHFAPAIIYSYVPSSWYTHEHPFTISCISCTISPADSWLAARLRWLVSFAFCWLTWNALLLSTMCNIIITCGCQIPYLFLFCPSRDWFRGISWNWL